MGVPHSQKFESAVKVRFFANKMTEILLQGRRYVDIAVFRTILKTLLKRVKNSGKIWVMWNHKNASGSSLHFSIILLYSLKLSILDMPRFMISSQVYATYSAQMTHDIFANWYIRLTSLINRGILVYNICLIRLSNSVSDAATNKSVLNLKVIVWLTLPMNMSLMYFQRQYLLEYYTQRAKNFTRY